MIKTLKVLVLSLALTALVLPPEQVTAITVSPELELTVPQMIEKYAVEYRVSAERMTRTIQCESTFNPDAIGDGGHSFGLSQIHLPSHPTVTREQALDEEFAIKFMAEQFSKGNARAWTCWRKLYAKNTP